MNTTDKENASLYRSWLEWIVRGMVAVILGLAWQVRDAQKDMLAVQTAQQVQIDDIRRKQAELYADLRTVQAQMVGWDVITRIERALAAMAGIGKGNEAMGVAAQVLRSEIDSRKNQTPGR